MTEVAVSGGELHLGSIFIYPVKSCAALTLPTVNVENLGLAHDRRWMLVAAESGVFITGREFPELVLLLAKVSDAGLELSARGPRPLPPFKARFTDQQRQVRIWSDDVVATTANAATNQALSSWLGRSVELVYFDACSQRNLDQKYATAGDQTAFSDGYPILLISQASLDALNTRLSAPISMRRFRPNLVVNGAIAAHAEDSWRRVQIGSAIFDVVKPCVRCVFTTVDAELGVRDPTGEPLNTLKSYRRTPKGITFGMNLIARSPGSVVTIGDAVRVLA